MSAVWRWLQNPQVIAAAVAGVFFALISPYGAVTYLPFAARAVYWLAVVGVVLMIYRGLLARVGDRTRRLTATVGLGSVAVFSLIVTVQVLIGRAVPLGFYPQLAASVVVVVVVIVGVFEALAARAPEAGSAQPEVAAPPVSAESSAIAAFRGRLPPHLRDAEFHAFQSEDHYVRVHTDRGDTLVLARLRDVETLFGEADGLKPHRSWFVLRQGVARVKRVQGRTVIETHAGLTLPASRTGARVIRDAGWL
ncbi:MAG: LytTR family DNA-binding domain-containing protein [Pseudomonadota bacterium]